MVAIVVIAPVEMVVKKTEGIGGEFAVKKNNNKINGTAKTLL